VIDFGGDKLVEIYGQDGIALDFYETPDAAPRLVSAYTTSLD
jgi:hypothetical protein